MQKTFIDWYENDPRDPAQSPDAELGYTPLALTDIMGDDIIFCSKDGSTAYRCPSTATVWVLRASAVSLWQKTVVLILAMVGMWLMVVGWIAYWRNR